MAANEAEPGPETAESVDAARDRRPKPDAPQRRKPQPITIDLAASSVRIGQQPDGEAPSESASEPEAVETTALPVDANVPETASTETVPGEPGPEPIVTERVTATAPIGAHAPEPASATASAEDVAATSPRPAASEHTGANAGPNSPAGSDTAAPTAKPPASRGNWPQLIAAGVIGGVIGIVTTYAIASAGFWPGPSTAAISAEVTALNARIAAAEAKVGPTGPLASELEHLKSIPSIPGVTVADVEKILDPFTAKTQAAIAHVDEIDKKIAGDQAIVRGEIRATQDALTTRMTSLETTATGSTAQIKQLGNDTAQLRADLASLDKKDAEHLSAAEGELSATIQALAARLNDLDTRTAAEFAVIRGGAGRANEEIAKAAKSIMDLTADSTVVHKSLADQADAIAKLQAQLQPMDDMRKAIDGLGARIGAVDDVKTILAQQAAKLGEADDAKKAADGVAASLWVVDQRMANIQARLTDLDGLKAALAGDAKEIAALQARLAPMETKVAAVDGYAETGLAARKQAVAAVAIANLKSAAESGNPFANELAAAKAIAGTTVDLAPLDAYSAKGLVSEAKLIEAFGPASSRIAEAVTPANGGDGILGALLSHAVGTVKVTPVTAEAGDSIAARLSRIDARLRAHDLPGALAEWQALPEQGRQASLDWGNALKTHVDGAKAVDTISAAVMTKLTAASQ